PFFAVVAGPITALNFLDFAAQRFGTALRLDEAWRRWSLGGRAVTAFLLLLLAAAAVPGWLEPFPAQRHLGWAVMVDPSLQRLAEQVRSWRDRGLLPEKARWFNTTTDVANYFAWFCPGERCFFDQRLPLFDREVAREYMEVRAALSGQGGGTSERREPSALD